MPQCSARDGGETCEVKTAYPGTPGLAPPPFDSFGRHAYFRVESCVEAARTPPLYARLRDPVPAAWVARVVHCLPYLNVCTYGGMGPCVGGERRWGGSWELASGSYIHGVEGGRT